MVKVKFQNMFGLVFWIHVF